MYLENMYARQSNRVTRRLSFDCQALSVSHRKLSREKSGRDVAEMMSKWGKGRKRRKEGKIFDMDYLPFHSRRALPSGLLSRSMEGRLSVENSGSPSSSSTLIGVGFSSSFKLR